jgi:hypothetical protein
MFFKQKIKFLRWVGMVLCMWAMVTVTQAAEAPVLPPAVMTPPPQPAKMPEFEFANLQGGALKSSDMKGKVVVIRFWATW